MKLTTTAFKPSEEIPAKYTCDGADVSPALKWEETPDGTRSFALICDDPDAPSGIFTHWVLFNLPEKITELQEDLSKSADVGSPKCAQGSNDFGKVGYNGPCPPGGSRHRYFFKLYALDIELNVKPKSHKAEVEAAMKGHVIEQTELMGTYQRKK